MLPLLVLGLLLSGCGSIATGEFSVDCPAPEISTWSEQDYNDLATEIELGLPLNSGDVLALSNFLKATQSELDAGSIVNIWETFPLMYNSVVEYMDLREQIEACN